jgi:hypothetical protein
MFVFFQVFGDVFGDKYVPSIAASHYPLRRIEARAREVGVTVQIYHATNRAAMHAHSDL